MIRRGTVADAAEIARIHVQTWRDAYSGIVPAEHLAALSEEERTTVWARRLAENSSPVWVDLDGGEMSGWVSGGPSRDAGRDGDAEVYALYVARRHWRQGVGRRLMAVIEGSFSGRGRVGVWVLRNNLPALRFYESLGYSPDGGEKEIAIGGASLAEIRLLKMLEVHALGASNCGLCPP